MEGSGDEEPGAEGPLQRVVKRHRKEKRELQGEGRPEPGKDGRGRRLPQAPAAGGGGGAGSASRSQRPALSLPRADAARSGAGGPGGAGGPLAGAFAAARLRKGWEWPLRCPPGADGRGEEAGGGNAALGVQPRFALGVVLVMREVCWMSRAVILGA